ncbi:MAG: RNA polymerase sigma factor, partial [Candidatus Manganitrophaceae bacterium]
MNEMISPFQEEDGDADDRLWIAAVRQGDRRALEELISRHQRSIYNLSLRMLLNRHDAEDATQEILIKLITKLSTFQGRSRFRTWLYRIAANHLLNMKRGRCEAKITSFDAYRARLDETPNLDLPDPASVPVDLPLLVEEAKIGCMTAMLLCLSREQRLVYLLGEIFQVGDVTGGKIMRIGRAHFRQKLSRARRDLHRFMNEQCGLLNKSNPC